MNFRKQVNRRTIAAAAVSGALLVPLGVFGAPALAGSTSASSAQYQYKITVCHKTHSTKHPWVKISVAAAAWKGHSKHNGDFIVTGTAVCPPTTAPTTTTAPQHGKSGEHGNNGNHGKGHGK